jgi:transcriptional regulator with XRE-family HTH domain
MAAKKQGGDGEAESEVPLVAAETNFAENLKAARASRNLTQADVADQMVARGFKWHPPTVYKVEKGVRPVQLGEALALAQILDMKVEDMAKPDDGSVLRRVAIAKVHLRMATAMLETLKNAKDYQENSLELNRLLAEADDLEELFPADVVAQMRAVAATDSDINKALHALTRHLFPAQWASLPLQQVKTVWQDTRAVWRDATP